MSNNAGNGVFIAPPINPENNPVVASKPELVTCRMYEQRFPEVDELVMVNVRQIAEMGAYVSLLEYNNIEGMILFTELSRRRIRSIQKLVRVGRNEVVVVMRVDKEKGYIDLSKRRVSSEDVERCENRFQNSKMVHSIMRHVAEKKGIALEALYSMIGWPLYKKFGHAIDAFKAIISGLSLEDGTPNDTKILDNIILELGLEVPLDVRKELVATIKKRLATQKVKYRADLEVICPGYDGVMCIKEALLAGMTMGTKETPLDIRLVAPPLYIMTTEALDKASAIGLMDKAIAKVEEVLTPRQGVLTLKAKPRAVNEIDDKELKALMEREERENAEVSGDEELSDMDGE